MNLRSLWNFADPAASEARFRALNPPMPGERAMVLAQIARAQGLQQRFDDAWHTLGRAELMIASESLSAEHAAAARASVELEAGRLMNSAGRGDRGAARFARALEAAESAGREDLAIDALHMLAIIETDPEKAHAWNQRALDAATRAISPEGRRWRGSILNNMGWAHHDAGRSHEALACFEQALEARAAAVAEDSGPESDVRAARWCVARCLRSLGKTSEALSMQEDLLAECVRAGTPDGYIHQELGECLRALGRDDEAAVYDEEAKRLLNNQ